MCTFERNAMLRPAWYREKPTKTLLKGERREFAGAQPMKLQTTKCEDPAIEKFTVEQTKEAYYPKAMTQFGMRGSEFLVDNCGPLVRKSTIHGCLQNVVPILLRERILHAELCLAIARDPGEPRMYNGMPKKFFLMQKANVVYQTVKKVCSMRAWLQTS